MLELPAQHLQKGISPLRIECNPHDAYDDTLRSIGADSIENVTILQGEKDQIHSQKRVTISSLSEYQKTSRGYNICIWLAGIGNNREGMKPISFLTHGIPSGTKERLILYRKRVQELICRSEMELCDFHIGGDAYSSKAIDMIAKMIYQETKRTIIPTTTIIDTGYMPNRKFTPETALILETEKRVLHLFHGNDCAVTTKLIQIVTRRHLASA